MTLFTPPWLTWFCAFKKIYILYYFDTYWLQRVQANGGKLQPKHQWRWRGRKANEFYDTVLGGLFPCQQQCEGITVRLHHVQQDLIQSSGWKDHGFGINFDIHPWATCRIIRITITRMLWWKHTFLFPFLLVLFKKVWEAHISPTWMNSVKRNENLSVWEVKVMRNSHVCAKGFHQLIILKPFIDQNRSLCFKVTLWIWIF